MLRQLDINWSHLSVWVHSLTEPEHQILEKPTYFIVLAGYLVYICGEILKGVLTEVQQKKDLKLRKIKLLFLSLTSHHNPLKVLLQMFRDPGNTRTHSQFTRNIKEHAKMAELSDQINPIKTRRKL